MPSSDMEPTLHCARPAPGCEARQADRVEVATPAVKITRGNILAFRPPLPARRRCGAGGVFIKRVIALPGETWAERRGFIYIRGKRLNEPYIERARRDTETYGPRTVPRSAYFLLGDNRRFSCDSRVWGPVPRENIIGPMTKVLRTE